MGFALLSQHFEKSRVPVMLPRFLPDDWKGAFVLLVMVFVLSSFLDNIAAALIGGTMAHQLFRAKVHIGYLAAIVAASNAGGSGSVIGDTTTTMMWIAGVSPLHVSKPTSRAAVALVHLRHPRRAAAAALFADHHATRTSRIHIDWTRVFIVALILVAAIAANVIVNVRFNEYADRFPVHRRRRLARDPRLRCRCAGRTGRCCPKRSRARSSCCRSSPPRR